MEYNEQNWNDVLDSLGFTEGNNNSFGGKIIYDDKGMPKWTYDDDDIEYKKQLYTFLSGAVYWKVHTMF